MRYKVIISVVAAMALLSACSSEHRSKQTIGTLLGAGIGGLAGSAVGKGGGRAIAIGIGTLFGAYIGSRTGESLDRADRLYEAQARQEALEYDPSGESREWHNPDSGHHGSVTPNRTYRDDYGSYCREFTQTVTIGGRTEEAYGHACRREDGSWQIVQS